jgi:hypothetical protein
MIMMYMMMMMMMIVYGDVDDDDDVEDDDAQPMTNTMMMVVGVITMMMYRCSNPVYHVYPPIGISIYLSIHQLHYHHKSNRYSMIDVWMDE